MFVVSAVSGRGLCDELVTRPEESYRLWCVVCDLVTSRMRRPRPALGGCATGNKKFKNYSSEVSYNGIILTVL